MNTYYDISIDTYKVAVELFMHTRGNCNLGAAVCADALISAIRSIVELECVDTELLRTHDLSKVCDELHSVGIDIPEQIKVIKISEYSVNARYPGKNYIEITLPLISEALTCTKTVLEFVNNYRVSKGMRIRNISITDYTESVWRDYCLRYDIAESQEASEILRLEALHNMCGKDLYQYINKKYLYTTSHEEAVPGKALICAFKQNLENAIELLRKFSIKNIRYGVFGSYARGMYLSTSDIDILAIWDGTPNIGSVEYSHLECALEYINCQITSVDSDYFRNGDNLFAREIRRDFKEIQL